MGERSKKREEHDHVRLNFLKKRRNQKIEKSHIVIPNYKDPINFEKKIIPNQEKKKRIAFGRKKKRIAL